MAGCRKLGTNDLKEIRGKNVRDIGCWTIDNIYPVIDQHDRVVDLVDVDVFDIESERARPKLWKKWANKVEFDDELESYRLLKK